MDKLKNKIFKSSLITAIALITIGILLIFKSEFTINLITYIIGGILVAVGALAIVRFIKNAKEENINSLDIVYGTVTIMFGMIVILNPKAIASIIPIIIGIVIIINSAMKLQFSFELKKYQDTKWKEMMIISIVSTICGLVLLCNPFAGAKVITQIIGIFIIVSGILEIIPIITIKKDVNKINKIIDQEAKDVEDAKIVYEETVAYTEEEKGPKKTKKKKETKKSKKAN